MLHRPRNSGRDSWWNQLPCGPLLTPISCTNLEIHSAQVGSPIGPKQVLEFGTSLCFTDQETQEETFGGTSSLVSQFLHPSTDKVQSSRSIQGMQIGQLFLNIKFFITFWPLLAIWNVGPVYASQIKKLRKTFFLVEPATWWVSFHTHLLCRSILCGTTCSRSRYSRRGFGGTDPIQNNY